MLLFGIWLTSCLYLAKDSPGNDGCMYIEPDLSAGCAVFAICSCNIPSKCHQDATRYQKQVLQSTASAVVLQEIVVSQSARLVHTCTVRHSFYIIGCNSLGNIGDMYS